MAAERGSAFLLKISNGATPPIYQTVAGLRTTAVRDGDSYVVNGAKTYITSGIRADGGEGADAVDAFRSEEQRRTGAGSFVWSTTVHDHVAVQ